jgi:hypothetical protein
VPGRVLGPQWAADLSRVGRLLVVLLLIEWDLLPAPLLDLSAYIEPRPDQYYEGLLRVSTDGDRAGWFDFFATKHIAAEVQLQPRRSRRQGTIYQCPECETRCLAEQWCPDCSTPCQRLGAGGICPCCQEMITIEELTENTAASSPLPVARTPVHQ